MLSIEGEERANILSKEKDFENIDTVFCSNYVKAMQTAKYFLRNNNLKLNIAERFNERKVGIYSKSDYPNYFCDQYWNNDFKVDEGESQNDVNKRMTEAFWEVVNNNQHKK